MFEVVRSSAVRCAVTTQFECIAPDSDPLNWGRFNVTQSDTPATLAAKLSGWYEPVAATIRAVKNPVARLLKPRLKKHAKNGPEAIADRRPPAAEPVLEEVAGR